MKRTFIINLLLLLTWSFSQSNAQTILPAERSVNWAAAGLDAAKPGISKLIKVTDYGAVADGNTYTDAAVQKAITALSGQSGIIYFPAGTYLLREVINLNSNTIIRGACDGATILKFNMNGSGSHCINISEHQTADYTSLIFGLAKGSDKVVVADSKGYLVGGYAEIHQENGAWDTQPATWAKYSVGQIVQIAAIAGDTLKLVQPLRVTLDAALHPSIRPISPVMNVGVEDLVIERADLVNPEPGHTIHLRYAARCWIQGVESRKSAGAHILMDACTKIEVKGSYFHHAFEYTGSGTKGYGVCLIQHTSECLIEDNIFQSLRHAMMVKQGANGNVFGYNYSRETIRPEFPANAGGDISLHGHFPSANLFEGNIVQNINIDQAWGPSGPFNTFFRNRAELYGIVMTSASDKQNFIGNEVPNKSFLMGNFSLSGSSHFSSANIVRGVINPAGSAILKDISLYRSNFGFWNGMKPLPPTIGVPDAMGTGSIPAHQRFLAGGKLTTGAPCVVTGANDVSQDKDFMVYPSPFGNELHIRYRFLSDEDITIVIYDAIGREVYHQKNTSTTTPEWDIIPGSIPAGMYFVTLRQGIRKYTERVIKIHTN